MTRDGETHAHAAITRTASSDVKRSTTDSWSRCSVYGGLQRNGHGLATLTRHPVVVAVEVVRIERKH
jgi:hypothetical protein